VLVRIHAVIVYRRLTKLNHVLQLPSAESMSGIDSMTMSAPMPE
jgi:hypothetical protein